MPKAASRPLARRSCRTLDPVRDSASTQIAFMQEFTLRALPRSLLLFALAGPAIGGIVTCVLVTLTVVLPDIWSDPGNTYGHARVTEYLGTLALVMVFAFPIGFVPAIVSGISQFCVRQCVGISRLSCTFLVCVFGVATMAFEQALFFSVQSPLPLIAAAISAALVSLAARNRHSAL